MTTNASRRVRVEELERVANRIKRFAFVPVDGQPLPIFSPGAHVIVTMRDGSRVWRNPYSLMSSPLDTSCYQISVLRVDDTRGGSAYMHEHVEKGATLEINEPVNLFPVDRTGRKHILIAGGIGITPFLAMIAQFKIDKTNFELHYAVRSLEEGAYCDLLCGEDTPGVFVYRSDKGQRIPLAQILENQPLGTHLYVCGPQRMIDWTLQTAKEQGWPKESVHYEHFDAPPPGREFVVKLAKSGREIIVGEHQSILEALEQAGVDAPYLCRGGACGQCVTAISNVQGRILHNDHYLSDDEKRCGDKIATCVSRMDGGSLTLDL
jgi:ferredoxin-NADP reductase